MRRGLAVIASALMVAGCTTPAGQQGGALITDRTVNLTPTLKLPLLEVVSGVLVLGAIHVIYDPLAPNWEIEESRLTDDTFRFSLKMKRYHTGGAGESMQVLKRRAAQLQGQLGYGAYQLVEYSEGIESQTFGARRMAEGTIRLVNRTSVDSFLQN